VPGELLALRWINPPTTAVQVQRRVEALVAPQSLSQAPVFVPLGRISPDLQHAVISAEDGRFYQHHGIDWQEVQKVVDKDMEQGKAGTRRFHHHAATGEESLPHHQPVAHPQSRGIHVGPGGRTDASQTAHSGTVSQRDRVGPGHLRRGGSLRMAWYNVPAAKINRDQAARMAAILPARCAGSRNTWAPTAPRFCGG
jgi:monofunctional glycosyltransferase